MGLCRRSAFLGDAYVDHPSFAAAVIGRTLQAAGYRVAIVPQPNWRDDLRDFRKFGAPRLFSEFRRSNGLYGQSLHSQPTTAFRRRIHSGGRHGMRPDYPTIVYSKILKELFPDVPLVAAESKRRCAGFRITTTGRIVFARQ